MLTAEGALIENAHNLSPRVHIKKQSLIGTANFTF